MSEVTYEWAIDLAGNTIHVSEATRGTKYSCPECSAILYLRYGPQRQAHFFHPSGAGCGGESYLHSTAKRLIHQAINDWIMGKGKAPSVSSSRTALNLVFAGQLDCFEANLESTLANGLRPDVTLLYMGNPVLAIEVRHLHQVPVEKANRYSKSGTKWIEVDARQILDDYSNWIDISEFQIPDKQPALVKRGASGIASATGQPSIDAGRRIREFVGGVILGLSLYVVADDLRNGRFAGPPW